MVSLPFRTQDESTSLSNADNAARCAIDWKAVLLEIGSFFNDLHFLSTRFGLKIATLFSRPVLHRAFFRNLEQMQLESLHGYDSFYSTEKRGYGPEILQQDRQPLLSWLLPAALSAMGPFSAKATLKLRPAANIPGTNPPIELTVFDDSILLRVNFGSYHSAEVSSLFKNDCSVESTFKCTLQRVPESADFGENC
jgi:hypothetical protein